LGSLCELFGYSRQAYYKREEDDGFTQDALSPLIVEKARSYREDNPGLGSVKLYMIIRDLFVETGCFPGRDAFIELLRKNDLMVRMKRRKHYRTTDSEHGYKRYPNLITDISVTGANQVWASDITYVETGEGVCYLSLVTDLYSHKIVGWALGPTLEAIYPIEALRMALSSIDSSVTGLIHHSDRGSQYCSQNYVKLLRSRNVEISMTQSGDPLENAIAERANGILKTEWLYRMEIATRKECKKVLERIIGFYNNKRPHMSIGYQTPDCVHQQQGEQKKCWRNPWDDR